jgi:hypothetical protein
MNGNCVAGYLGIDGYTDTEGRKENQIKDRGAMLVGVTESVVAEDCKIGDQLMKLKDE